MVKWQENYRFHARFLAAANALIAHESERIDRCCGHPPAKANDHLTAATTRSPKPKRGSDADAWKRPAPELKLGRTWRSSYRTTPKKRAMEESLVRWDHLQVVGGHALYVTGARSRTSGLPAPAGGTGRQRQPAAGCECAAARASQNATCSGLTDASASWVALWEVVPRCAEAVRSLGRRSARDCCSSATESGIWAAAPGVAPPSEAGGNG